jgi:hypothetical protein
VLTKALLLLSDMCTLSKKKGYSSYYISLLHFHLIKYDVCLHFQLQLKAELPLGIGQFVNLSYSPKLFSRFEGPQVPIVKNYIDTEFERTETNFVQQSLV